MTRTKKLHNYNALQSGCALFAIALASNAAPAFAQDTAPAASEAPETAIIVTGSRIRRDPLSQDSPIVFIDSADIERSGLSSAADLLQRLPSAGGALNSKFNNSGNFGNPPDGGGVGAGSAEIDLRYLSSRRTLVLVDGLRYVSGASASGVPGATDLNSIPEGIIDRIEVLQGGASPIYGSDAVAGVVNIITKLSQEGLAASAQIGQYRAGDGQTQNYQLSYGVQDRNSGTSVVFGVNYVKQERVNASDRQISLFPAPGATSCLAGGCSSATPLGRFIVNNPLTGEGLNLTLKGPVGGRPDFDPLNPTGPLSDFTDFTTASRFNFAPFNLILTPSERYGAFVNVKQELSDTVNLRLKAVYNHRTSRNEAAPLPLFIGPDAGNGNLLDTISVDVTNPFNPFGVTLNSGANGTPRSYDFIARRFVENGNRRYKQDVDTFYISGTVDGSFTVGERQFYWDVNAVYGQNDAHQEFSGNVNAQRLQRALGPVANCVGAADGCVPFNIFGGAGSITQAQIDYVAFTDRARSEQRLADASFNLSGSLFDLPAGPLGIAVGYEHRDQRGSFTPDPVVTAGFGADIPAQPTAGQINVDEFYGELNVPILADTPFFQSLEASFAARYSNYSRSGTETTLKAGLDWRPTDDLLLRGSFSQGFRAPSIGELFGSASRFDQELVDPCSDLNNSGASATVRANCISQGVPSSGSYVQNNPQISVITGGNQLLQAETSDSYSGGFVYSPSFLRDSGFAKNVSLEVTYYNISVDGAIQAINANTLLGRCAGSNDALSCATINRTSSGAIANITGLLQNIAGIETDGLDVNFLYRSNETGFGSFGLSVNSNFLFSFTETVPSSTGVTVIPREGTERGSPDQAYPKFKSTGVVDWTLGSVNAAFTGRYISAVTEADGGNRLAAKFYGDVLIGWKPSFLNERFGITLGVLNVFNATPPDCISCGLNNFDPTTYDVPGQFGYVRLNYKM